MNLMGLPAGSAQAWAREQMTGAQLGHGRRRERAVRIAAAMAQHPGKSIPQLFDRKYDVNAAYDFLKRKEATPERIQNGSRRQVMEQARQSGGVYLFIEDTSEMSWVGNDPVEGLGPIGSGAEGLQGFLLHSVLVAQWPWESQERPEPHRRPPVELLGLGDQQYRIRRPRPKGEVKGHPRRQGRRRVESDLWEISTRRLGPCPRGTRWVRVCDRGADIYEALREYGAQGHGFVIRAAQDRCLEDPATGAKGDVKLFEAARSAPAWGHFDLPLRSRPGQRARQARLNVSSTTVRLRSPYRPPIQAGAQPGIDCAVVRVWEAPAPGDVKRPLEWILLCDRLPESFEQALEISLQYSTRWLIEEFHKALKSGLGAERLQLESAERLFAAIAIMSLVALRLVNLRELTRRIPEAPAHRSGLSELELDVLRVRTDRSIQTLRDVALAIGRLGGHMNRKSDGLPGWITLWRGKVELDLLVQGVLLAKKVKEFRE